MYKIDKKEYYKYTSLQNEKIIHTLEKIEINKLGTVLILSKDEKLLGVITDGDIRKSLLKSRSLNILASDVMNRAFIFSHDNKLNDFENYFINHKHLRLLPIVDNNLKLIELYGYARI
jgi:CBS domain-containing protein